MRLVADYRFFQSVGNGSLAFSARYLVGNFFFDNFHNEKQMTKRNFVFRFILLLIFYFRFILFYSRYRISYINNYWQINVIDRVNVLYTSTEWGQDDDGRRLINMGFMIKDMLIHNESTYGPIEHYNAATNMKRNVNKLLEVHFTYCYFVIFFIYLLLCYYLVSLL